MFHIFHSTLATRTHSLTTRMTWEMWETHSEQKKKKMVINKCRNCARWKGFAHVFKVTWKRQIPIQIACDDHIRKKTIVTKWVERRAGVKIGTRLQTISLFFLSRFNGQKSSLNSTIDCNQCHSFHQMFSLAYRRIVAFENIEAQAGDRQQKKKKKQNRVIKIDFPVELNGVG